MDASSVDQIHLEDQIVLFLGGELDIATVPILQERLAELSTEGVDNIEIDLSNLGFIDSSGLAVLVRSRDDLKRSGGSLVVRNASKAVLRLFEATGLNPSRVLDVREPTQSPRHHGHCIGPVF